MDYANQAASRSESIREFRLVEGELTEDERLLMAPLEGRAAPVTAAYEAEIEVLCGS
ncbi:hypothetical protein [Streptomyces vastus]|uniref:Uncharacterized protein n=1 Tax=Streptomyces vastus TaxID=285451 RepID=A0ABP6E753_9ACTN